MYYSLTKGRGKKGTLLNDRVLSTACLWEAGLLSQNFRIIVRFFEGEIGLSTTIKVAL
jgi:hypothetical protein